MNTMKPATKKPANLCACGKRMNKYANLCKACHITKMEELHAAARTIVATGKCPHCAGALRRNSSMTGWWQCEQLGAESHRKDSTKPSCLFQTFTE
jgi:hypothetical protein